MPSLSKTVLILQHHQNTLKIRNRLIMITFIKIFLESISQAIGQLRSNKLRSLLSLLGITIGIFSIIAVDSSVDSLEDNIRGSFEKLGRDVIFINKMSWGEDPGKSYWKFMRRPSPSYDDYKAIVRKSKKAQLVAFQVVVGQKLLKYRSSNVPNAFLLGVSYDYAEIFKTKFEKGRYYSPIEYQLGTSQVILGHQVSENLFGSLDPIGRIVDVGGHKLQVIGVIEKSGKSVINVMDFDNVVLTSLNLTKKIASIRSNFRWGGSSVMVKATKDTPIEDLKGELTGILRAERQLKPVEDDNFSLNELSILSKLLDGLFGVIGAAGNFIGIFALLVGMFGVANIMFVSVKERTSIIGIKKALGAKRWFILTEFLVESIILCIIGGIMGLLLVYGGLQFLKYMKFSDFEIYLSSKNILRGIIWSVVVGVLSGFIPAWQASKMDPVEAIRK
jgi:putative ABC transport system permease protein